MWRIRAAILTVLFLAGCDMVGEQKEKFVPARPVTSIAADTIMGTAKGAWSAVQMPLEDLNLKRQAIPEALYRIIDNPYIPPTQISCDSLYKEIMRLDVLLGPDICTPSNPTGMAISRKGEYIDRGAELARNQVIGIVRGKVDIIPFRGMVRHITGAEKHSKQVERAYNAGRLRRAFLKGLSSGAGCIY